MAKKEAIFIYFKATSLYTLEENEENHKISLSCQMVSGSDLERRSLDWEAAAKCTELRRAVATEAARSRVVHNTECSFTLNTLHSLNMVTGSESTEPPSRYIPSCEGIQIYILKKRNKLATFSFQRKLRLFLLVYRLNFIKRRFQTLLHFRSDITRVSFKIKWTLFRNLFMITFSGFLEAIA
jgi:hypothetical protein